MKRLILILLVFLYFIQLNAIIEESADLYDFFFSSEPNCAYSKWESHIVEGIAEEGYNMYAPYDRQTEGFGQFSLPTDAQNEAWESAIDYFFAGQYNDAQNVFVQNNIPYSVVKFIDGTNTYYMLRENLNTSYIDNNGTTPTYDDEIGSFDLGWGIFVYRSTNPNPVLVSAPHPNDDFISPYFSVKSFLEFDAQYLMINGSGREVMWNGYGSYSNNKSLSDPTRNYSHPFNYFYKKACDRIRADFDRRELSVQLHSYDWDSHPDLESCQISPGQYRRPAGLPIRDFSPLRQDVIQNTDYVVVPQGTIGNNEQVTVRDYYSVHNMYFETVYNDSLIISNNVDLPGYPNSFHDSYSTGNYSDWDVFSPFFHVELDELPNCYPQTDEAFKGFYGYNSYSNLWNISQKYSKLSQYYEPFIEALKSSIDTWIEFDDGEIPEAPTNLRRFYGLSGNVIAWDTAPCYDFYTYEILYSLNPISQGQYSVLNRDSIDKLAFPIIDYAAMPNLELNQTYHIAMRTVDYNGNVSPLSEEIVYTTLPITTTGFDIFADNSNIQIEWTMNQQQNCAGFEIYRSQDGLELELYSTYTTNSDLEINSSTYENFNFSDDNVEMNHTYTYRVNVVNNLGQSDQVSQMMNASLANYITLTATGSNWDNDVTFGKSFFATQGYDETYDELNEAPNTYLALSYNNQEFIRNIVSEFDPTEDVQYIDLIFDNPPTNLSLSLDLIRNSERFYIQYDNELYSLDSESVELSFPDNGTYNAKLIWGNLQPNVVFPHLANKIIYEGDVIDLSWDIDYPELVDSYDLYFQNEQDSVLIVANLTPDQTTYTFTNNVSDDYRMINYVVRVNSIDGQSTAFKSNSQVVLVSEIQPLNLYAEDSNQLFSYPFTEALDTNLLAGNIEAFEISGEEFVNSENLTNTKGYLINIMNDYQLSYNGSPVFDDVQYQLNRGWNLINNVHPIDYPIKDILFEKNGIIKTFKNFIDNDNIFPVVLGIREGCYTSIDTLRAFESAFLYLTTNDLVNILFDPVNNSEELNISEADLFFTLEFKTASGAKDELIVGLQSGITPMIDPYYDLIKPPLRPTYGLIDAYIVSEVPLSNYYPKMHTKLLEPTQEDTYNWNIAFTNTLEEPVQVRIKDDNNSDNYPLDLNFGGEILRLNHDFQTISNTEQSGTFEASLTIMTVTENSDNDVQALSQFQVSPNPISTNAKINIKNIRNRDYSITIYNLKGQKVKSYSVKNSKADSNIINWDLTNNKGKKVTSGIYFIKYKDGIRNDTKKVCIIK